MMPYDAFSLYAYIILSGPVFDFLNNLAVSVRPCCYLQMRISCGGVGITNASPDQKDQKSIRPQSARPVDIGMVSAATQVMSSVGCGIVLLVQDGTSAR
jgi:hypothetical protein